MRISDDFELVPTCPRGFTKSDLDELFGIDELMLFWDWMYGQTMALCDGQAGAWIRMKSEACSDPTWPSYDPEHLTECILCDYVGFASYPDGCGLRGRTHGPVVYRYDVERYIQGGSAKAVWD